MPQILREIRDIKRFNQILLVLFEEGFGYLLSRAKLGRSLTLSQHLKSKLSSKKSLKPEERLRRTLERLGPTFIKFGQVLSIRPDLVPLNYSKELEKLLDKVPPVEYSKIKSIVEMELGKTLNEVFKSFDKKPIASASISQVHAATLKDGTRVAVKVQRPKIKEIMETDIDIMFYIAHLLETHVAKLKDYKPVQIVKEFKEWTEKELDFRLEARNIKRFRANFAGSRTVKIPDVYEKISTENVLVLEFIEGIELNDYKSIVKKGINFDAVLSNGINAVLEMVFIHGLFHADPHPGNIIVTRDGKIAFVDFGIVGFFDERLKNKSTDLLYGIIESQQDVIVDTLLSMGIGTSNLDIDAFRMEVASIIEPLQSSSIKDIKLSSVLEEVIELLLKYKLKIPASFVLFGKTIITLEGIALEYSPDFKIVDATKPFVERIIAKRSSPAYLLKSLAHNANRYRRFAEELPDRAERALERIEKGSLKLDLKDTDIRRLAFEIDRSSNRITYGLIISALLLASAVTVQFSRGPILFGIPILSLMSLLFALMLGFVLFVSVIREKHTALRGD